jgi:hypothetical protein
LAEGTNHRSATVRKLSAEILSRRNKLPISDAERLMSDADEGVRFVALSSLVKNGRSVSEEQAKTTLVRQADGALLAGYPAGDRQFTRFKESILAKRTDAELEALAGSASVFDRDAKLALLKRHFPRKSDELCRLVEDNFKEDFAISLRSMVARYGEESQYEQQSDLLPAAASYLTRNYLSLCERRTVQNSYSLRP